MFPSYRLAKNGMKLVGGISWATKIWEVAS
jgi:hypothetical protein